MHRLKLIGTSHIASQSVSEIKRMILSEKPDIVAIELDKYRFPQLFKQKNKLALSEITRVGFTGYLFAKIGAWLQKSLGKEVRLAPGADMRAAVKAAQQVNAKLVLIDRPIQQTLQRLSSQMTFFEKLKFFTYIFGGVLFKSGKSIDFDLQKVPEKDLIEKLSNDLKKNFPAIYKVLVKERDEYLANQLKLLLKQSPNSTIFAVIGAGHLKGMQKALKSQLKD